MSSATEVGYRNEHNCRPGFNLVVIDVDNNVSMKAVKILFKNYKWLIYPTKRHTAGANRFRIVFPLSHNVKLNSADFAEFMENVYAWLPFKVDEQTDQRSRKWLTCQGAYEYNEGESLNALLFIPKTKKAEEQQALVASQESLNNLERWFVNNTASGNRSNQLIRYGYILVDMGLDIDSIRNNVLALNEKLPDKLSETEILTTIMVTVSKAIHTKGLTK